MKNKKKLDIGGMSFPDQINFFGENGSVEIDTHNYENKPNYEKDKPYSLFKRVNKIPFIRGYAMIIDLVYQFLKSIFKNVLSLLLFLLVIFYVFFAPQTSKIVTKSGPLSNIVPDAFWTGPYLSIGFISLVVVWLFLATKNHGAEHKCISAYTTTQNLSYNTLKSQPKENRRCGTVLVVWVYILAIPLLFINTKGITSIFLQLTVFSIGYEIFRLASKETPIGNFIYFFGWLGQKITTREPSDKLLLRARDGIKKLLDEEGYTYKH